MFGIFTLTIGPPPEGFTENPTGQNPLQATYLGRQTNL
jgi:hypothetical protein